MKTNYKILYIKSTDRLDQFLEAIGGFGIFLDSGILIDGALNNVRFRAYSKLFDDLFMKSKNIVLETSVINIIEAMKILLSKAMIHFIVDEFTHHENELKYALEKYQNYIIYYYEDIKNSYGKTYIKRLGKFLKKYKINVIDSIYIPYEIIDEDLPEFNYSMLEDEELLNLFLLYKNKIEYNDFLSLAIASQSGDDMFITTDNELVRSVRDSRISSIHIFPYVYSVANKENVEILLEELSNLGLIEDYRIEKIK